MTRSNPLDRWQLASAPGSSETPGAVSFGISDSVEEAAVWQIDLPADPRAARALIAQNEAMLLASELALSTTIPEMVDRFTLKARGSGAQPTSATAVRDDQSSFSSLSSQRTERTASILADNNKPYTPAERGLMRWLEKMEQDEGQALTRSTADQVSFGIGDEAQKELQKIIAEFQGSAGRLIQLVTHYACLETRSEGVLLGRTIVNWTGDMNTVLGENLTSEQIDLHRRSTALALSSRAVLLKKFVTTTQAALKLSVIMTTPGGAILALPAAWGFISQFLADIQPKS